MAPRRCPWPAGGFLSAETPMRTDPVLYFWPRIRFWDWRTRPASVSLTGDEHISDSARSSFTAWPQNPKRQESGRRGRWPEPASLVSGQQGHRGSDLKPASDHQQPGQRTPPAPRHLPRTKNGARYHCLAGKPRRSPSSVSSASPGGQVRRGCAQVMSDGGFKKKERICLTRAESWVILYVEGANQCRRPVQSISTTIN